MNKEFVPYEQALELKKLGFDEPCILLYRGLDTQPVCQMGYEFKTEKNSDYNDETNYWLTVPLYQQAFRFFNEKYGLYHYNIRRDYYISEDGVRSYDDIELECLKKLIEIAKK